MSLEIVVVEDVPLNAALVLAMLEMDGHLVHVAASGAEFTELLTRVQPDIVLIDELLPDTRGTALLRATRDNGGLMGVPAIAVTALALTGDRERLLAAGFDEVLTKPLDTRTFVASVVRVASRGG